MPIDVLSECCFDCVTHLKCHFIYGCLIAQSFICSWLHLFVAWLKRMHLQVYIKKITWAYELEFEGKQQNVPFGVISRLLELYFSAFFLLKEERGYLFYAGLLYGYNRHCFLKPAIFARSFKEIFVCVCVPVYMHIYISAHTPTCFLSCECSKTITHF